MRLYSDLVVRGRIDVEEWERRAASGMAVGKCRCGGLLSARPAEKPQWSSVTYRDIVCSNGHEASLTSDVYEGRVIEVGRAHVDITEARHELRVIREGES